MKPDIAAYARRNIVMRDGLVQTDRPVDAAAERGNRNRKRLKTRAMRVDSTFRIAFRALRRNKLRSVLTALGIIIGVGAVVAMVSIGNGAKAQVEATNRQPRGKCDPDFFRERDLERNSDGLGERRHAEDRRRRGDPARSAGGDRGQRGSDFHEPGFGRQSELVHPHLRRVAGILRHPAMAVERRRDLHSTGCAERKQGLRDRTHHREPDLRIRESDRPGACASKACLFSSPACSRRKGSARRERIRMTSSSCPTPAP